MGVKTCNGALDTKGPGRAPRLHSSKRWAGPRGQSRWVPHARHQINFFSQQGHPKSMKSSFLAGVFLSRKRFLGTAEQSKVGAGR